MPHKRRTVLVLFFFFLQSSTFAPPPNESDYNVTLGGLVDIPDGSYVEGSSGHGGIQPDYHINLSDPALKRAITYAHRIGNSDMEYWDKIGRIESYVITRALPNRDYHYPAYRNLLKGFATRGQNIPLASYAICQAGVCREYARCP